MKSMLIKCILFSVVIIQATIAHAVVIVSNDPTDDNLYKKYSDYNENTISELQEMKSPVDYYLLGYLYLRGDDRLDIASDKQEALSLLTKAWEGGVVDAGYGLALLDYNLTSNISESRVKKYLESSAENGYIKSQRLLGKAYAGEVLGDIIEKNISKAIYWFKKAAENGDQISASKLSVIYEEGAIVAENPKEAYYWRVKASEAKYGFLHMVSFRVLAKYYENGYGVNKDFVKAYKYYDLSGTAGSKGKERVSKNMSEDEINEAVKQSRAWQEEHNTFVPSYNGLRHQSDGSYR